MIVKTALALRCMPSAGIFLIVYSAFTEGLGVSNMIFAGSRCLRGKVLIATILNFENLLSRLLSEHHAGWNLS
jgi:hypothetical protein